MSEPRIRLGILTPSSNTVLEPLTQAMLAVLPGTSAHFARFRVTEIALSPAALAQFDDSAILRAAELLADARVDVIGWSGTSGGWLGFEADARLCRRITEATGIPATTSMLALNEILASTGVTRMGLVTPYRGDLQAKIIANYAGIGVDCVAERHLGLQENFAFAAVEEARVERMVREVAAAGPQAVAVVCTNLRGALRVPLLEAELGLPVYDSIATVLWKALHLAGAGMAPMARWGSIFALPAQAARD
ncbi:aspartate/glutamate racemase family protein [Roseomonas sp. E05]|uniref:maleate cis-trans isomerase family protein n=1 Tax=Roseomonas sp. E05 TaxID=3046310 RepID=UPI0024BB6A8D|nr:aspartate/glutamate racemase family protein [Roseomonas sp. E05]MDJ0386913.1 aspartate/glutamate racemase family protein [Roseomonas sp. E05]